MEDRILTPYEIELICAGRSREREQEELEARLSKTGLVQAIKATRLARKMTISEIRLANQWIDAEDLLEVQRWIAEALDEWFAVIPDLYIYSPYKTPHLRPSQFPAAKAFIRELSHGPYPVSYNVFEEFADRICRQVPGGKKQILAWKREPAGPPTVTIAANFPRLAGA